MFFLVGNTKATTNIIATNVMSPVVLISHELVTDCYSYTDVDFDPIPCVSHIKPQILLSGICSGCFLASSLALAAEKEAVEVGFRQMTVAAFPLGSH